MKPGVFISSKEEDGSALVTVLIITVIASLMIGAVLSGLHLQSLFIQKDIKVTQARYLAEKGAYEFLHKQSSSWVVRDTAVVMDEGLRDSVWVEITPFGGFLQLSSTAYTGNQKALIAMTFGEQSSSVFEYAVVLGDTTSSINLIGSTSINGDIVSGKQGVKESSFKGFPFSGNYDGESIALGRELEFPDIRYEFITEQMERVQSDFKANKYSGIGVDEYLFLPEPKKNESVTLFSNSDLVWPGQLASIPDASKLIVRGNLTINEPLNFGSKTKIFVRDTLIVNSKVEGSDLIFFVGGPVTIGGNATFSGQIVSENSITLKDDAYLVYPSMLFTSLEFLSGNETEAIRLTGNAMLDGTIIYPIQTNTFNQERLRVKVEEGATVRGAVYSQGQTELDGTVLGSVLTRQFYFYESPTSYINWIKDATIDISQRPENYIVPFGFSDSIKYVLLDWELKE